MLHALSIQRHHEPPSPHRAAAALVRRASSVRAASKQVTSTNQHATKAFVHDDTIVAQPSRHISPESLASYTISTPPTHAQLKYASRYFLESRPTFLSGASKFRTLPLSTVPEVAFLGRSNVGKSSLLNALVQRTSVQLARISSKPGRTREMNAFGVGGATVVGGRTRDDGSKEPDCWMGRGGLVVLDMPGYGKASREEWGKEITKYLSGREQLRRAFVLVDAEHGLKRSDSDLLEMLRQHGIAHQVVLSKVDKVLVPRGKVTPDIINNNLPKLRKLLDETRVKIVPEQRHGPRALEDIVTCSSEKELPVGSGAKIGIDNLRWAVLSAAGLDCDQNGNKKSMEYMLQADDVVPQDSDPYRAGP